MKRTVNLIALAGLMATLLVGVSVFQGHPQASWPKCTRRKMTN
jgi:hypothetical protein